MRAAWRRARADLWPLLVTLLVVALTVGLTDAVPRLLIGRADVAVRAALAAADPPTDLVVTSMYGPGASDAAAGSSDTTASVDNAARWIDDALPPSLQPVLGPPVAAATSTDLTLSTPGLPTGGVLWMAYLWAGHQPAVRWLTGAAPGHPGEDGAVQLGLSRDVARVLGVGAGDTFQARMPDRTIVPVLVTGVFEATDPQDPAWTARPEVLRPRVVGLSSEPSTVVGGLLTAASLPAARAALEPDGVTRTFRFPVDPQTVDYTHSRALGTQIAALEASPEVLLAPGPGPTVTSRLDLVLTQVRARVAATWTQAMVVLAGLACGSVLVLLVAADLLARRRLTALRTVRARGASLAGIAAASAAESGVVVGVGAVAGLALGAVAAGGAVTWPWVVVVVAVGVLAPPAFATVTAARSDARRVPTDRHRRRLAQRVRVVRRVSFEAALLVLGVAALAVLRGRGVRSISGSADLVLAAAPVLVAAAGALLLWRAVPALLGGALRVARRSRSAGPLLAVARARSTGAGLPFVALVVVTMLVSLCGALAGTARAGQTAGSWDSVGADVVVRTDSPNAALADVAADLAAADGVDAVAFGRVQDRADLFDVDGVDTVRVLAVDPVPYGKMLARTRFGADPALATLADASGVAVDRTAPGPVPALVPAAMLGSRPSLRWGGVTVDLDPVGEVSALPAQLPDGSPAGPTVVVDRAALTAVVGAVAAARAEQTGSDLLGAEPQAVDPDTVWAVGPGAPAAARTAAAPVTANVLPRTQWLADRRSDPLAGGLLALVGLVAVVCAGFASILVVLGAAASAPERARSLATARVLGLRGRDTVRLAAGELLPPTLLAAVGGVVLGMVLVGTLVAPLALRLVTGQATDPGVVLPWWAAAPVVVLAATVLAVVVVESSARRRERLGQVLRVR
ncbi:FtsX-like permease family protein [Cellulomonas sp. URHE0023]|uniref:FtsX-like permease family protein n=1 Tax=Cellulomonas sp. URHE0023 TaxID=1380354 RepID=UPI00047F43BC|nr:FtsX-like permease family protein [Cellulomonas sp. URHE0023]